MVGQNLKSSVNLMIYVFIADEACTSNFKTKLEISIEFKLYTTQLALTSLWNALEFMSFANYFMSGQVTIS